MAKVEVTVEEKKVLSLSDEGFHRIAYREWNGNTDLPVVLCVHGLTRLSHDFDPLAQALSSKYRVVCPDLPGRGNSSWLRKQRNYNFLQYCADIGAVIARINAPEIHFVGTSLGGLIGMTLASMHRSPIKSLIMNDCGPEPQLSEMRKLGRYIGKAPDFHSLREARHYIQDTYTGFGELTKEQWKTMTAYSTRQNEDVISMHYDPNLGDAFRSSYSYYGYNLWKYWRRIDCPTFIVRGELSTFLNEATLEKMLTRGTDVQYVTIANTGHAPLFWAEDEIKTLKKFIDSVEDGTHIPPE